MTTSVPKRVFVPVHFDGFVAVDVPYDWPNETAAKIALAVILASTDNPDAPVDEAYDDVEEILRAHGRYVAPLTGDAFDEAVDGARVAFGEWTAGEPGCELHVTPDGALLYPSRPEENAG